MLLFFFFSWQSVSRDFWGQADLTDVTVPVREAGSQRGRWFGAGVREVATDQLTFLALSSLLTLSPPSPGAFSDQRLELNTLLAFPMEELELGANRKQTFGALGWRRPSKQIKLPHQADKHAPCCCTC